MAKERIVPGRIGQAQRAWLFQHRLEPSQELAPEQSAQGLDREEELALFGRAPALTVAAQGAARHNAMEMRMEIELLAPGMEDRADAQVALEPVASELEEALGSGIGQ